SSCPVKLWAAESPCVRSGPLVFSPHSRKAMGRQPHHTFGRRAAFVRLITTLTVIANRPFSDGAQTGAAESESKLVYTVGRILLEYGPRNQPPQPALPPLDDLLKVRVNLGRDGDTYVPPTPSGPSHAIVLGELQNPERFSAAALLTVNRALIDELNHRGIYGA